MASWSEIAAAEPEFAAMARVFLDAHQHKTIATVRRDGSPRISGTEATFVDGDTLVIESWTAARGLRRIER